ncbi:sec8 exocyst complex component specific domain-containing protein [Ditylenchus destructor]|uniref:Exocyst complex component Sec8 n=1 Tax=Ditylenchus destructor TaxID=166010 RepID=A0AAD4R2I6_9BILA|nr:sec8 exocyst complex component specific domain-containing protein [Ditylenchus destructor]
MDRPNRTKLFDNGPTTGNSATSSGSVNQDPISSGLLISVIKTLTSTVSDDQRQLERSRLEKGYEDSGLIIDRLLKEHHADVSDCLNSFRKVSNGITTCRERIQNAKNALHTCKSLLQCRRDDLKKLWMESAEQNYMNNILQQIHEMKHMDQTIGQFLKDAKYRDAVDALKRADILLNGPLSQIDGLNQLRTNVTETSQVMFEKIVQDLLHCIVQVPFDCQNLELMKGLHESSIAESVVCVNIISRYSTTADGGNTQATATLPAHLLPIITTHQQSVIRNTAQAHTSLDSMQHSVTNIGKSHEAESAIMVARLNECLEALKVFDQLDSAMERILNKTAGICHKAINDSIAMLRLLMKDGVVADSTHLAQLVQVIVQQIRCSTSRFTILTKELQKLRPAGGGQYPTAEAEANVLITCFWDAMQNVLETVLGDHLDISRLSTAKKSSEVGQVRQKSLFSFENTSFSATANSSLLKKKQLNLICPATPYNITAIFHMLNRFCTEIEKQLNPNSVNSKEEIISCKLNTFLNTYVMETFVETIRHDMERRAEQALVTGSAASNVRGHGSVDVWSALSVIPSYNVKVLTSCLRIFELCEQINDYIQNMSSYTQRFASLWLLIIGDYTKSATDMYSQAHMPLHFSRTL